jgi:spoIIIJ-associated protein
MQPVDSHDPNPSDNPPDDNAPAPVSSNDPAPQGEDADFQESESDPQAELAWDFLDEVLREMQMDVGVKRRKPRNDSGPEEIRLEVIGRDAGRVIGKKGQVLAALQYLVSRVVNRPGQPRRHVVIDAEGYRERREASLADMAKRLGQQAAQEGKIITFEPMSPRDRRVVHLALATFSEVVTRSDGEGEDRRVRIIPVRK